VRKRVEALRALCGTLIPHLPKHSKSTLSDIERTRSLVGLRRGLRELVACGKFAVLYRSCRGNSLFGV
jgi:hypothetical protein